MPRLRPIQKKEETEDLTLPIPEDKSVSVTLEGDEDATVRAVEVDIDKKEPVEPEKRVEKAKVVEKPEDDGSQDLKEQLRLAQEAQQAAQKLAEDHQRRLQEAETRLREQSQEVSRFKTEAEQAQYDAISNALASAQGKSDSASRDYQTALANSDYAAAAEAQRRIARSETRMVQLEDGKAALESRREAQKTETKPQGDQFEAAIAQYPQRAQSWLRTHRDFATNPANNSKIQAAHWALVNEGIEPYSDAYFEKFEEKTGIRQKTETRQAGEKIVSAPPSSRSSGNGSAGRTVTLSPAEREAARISGLSETQYAREKAKILMAEGKL